MYRSITLTLVRVMLLLAAPVAASGQTSAIESVAVPELAERAAVSALAHDLDGFLADAGPAHSGVLIVSLTRGDTLYSRDPDAALSPASNMKLFTTAAALYYLGPDYRYTTDLVMVGDLVDGTLIGDVVLRGSGDPSMSGRLIGDVSAPLRAMADALAARGVRTVEGDVVGDGTVFDDVWIGPAWEEDDRMAWYAAPVGGLNFAENMVTVRVLPRAVGEPARVRTTPATSGLAVRNEVRTVGAGATRVSFDLAPDGIVVRGTIRPAHGGVSRSMPVVDPARYAAAALRAALEDRGIEVRGEVRSGRAMGGPPQIIYSHRSPPLGDLLHVTNHVSHNMFAEALLKTVGRVVEGEGTFAAGARAVERFVAKETGDLYGLDVIDGSGLSRPNRASARGTVALLARMREPDFADDFRTSLPAAGQADGLRRMYDSPAAGNLRAKTGTIRHVSALSGYVTAANGELLAFSIIGNGFPASWRGKTIENRIGVRLAEFTR